DRRTDTLRRAVRDAVHAISTCIQRMQKALTQMNIQLANVISDLSGWTGMRIVRAILGGERDPQALAALSHPGIRATRDTIAKSREGTWQLDLLFVLQQEVVMYDANNTSSSAIRRFASTSKASPTGAPTRLPQAPGPPRLPRDGAPVPSGGGKRAAMPHSLTWA